VSAPSRDGVHCDDHSSAALVHRADDAEETIRRRLEVYAAQTAPLVEHYRDLGRLVEVDGMGEMNGVYTGLKRAIDAVRAAR
jgi:adenylate kinase